MNKTKVKGNKETKMLVDTLRLQEMLCCGRKSAVDIGTAANARVSVGRRVLWNVGKVEMYLNAMLRLLLQWIYILTLQRIRHVQKWRNSINYTKV